MSIRRSILLSACTAVAVVGMAGSALADDAAMATRSSDAVPAAVAHPKAVAQTPSPALPLTTAQQIDMFVHGGQHDGSALDANGVAPDNDPDAPQPDGCGGDGKPHGEVGAMVGTHDTRAAWGAVRQPVGKHVCVAVAVSQSHGRGFWP